MHRVFQVHDHWHGFLLGLFVWIEYVGIMYTRIHIIIGLKLWSKGEYTKKIIK